MNGTLDREKLAKTLGLLGSAHDGEILAAARQAERMRREARMTWYDLILTALPAPERSAWPDSRTAGADDYLHYLADRMADLTEWERDFVLSLRARPGRFLTQKQIDCVLKIAERVRPPRAEGREGGCVIDLAPHAEAIARRLLGTPNPGLSTKVQLRFGTNGSVAVEIAAPSAGTWFDHETRSAAARLDLLRLKGGWRTARLSIGCAAN